MTKTSKLETLKILVREWKLTRGFSEADAVCEYLAKNLDLSEQEGKE